MTDNLTPVRCGCGGEAKVYEWFDGNSAGCMQYFVYCFNCGTAARCDYDTEDEAITAWNRAMGERTAKVETVEKPNVYKCGNCGQYMHRTIWSNPVKYCPSCGSRLEWEE